MLSDLFEHANFAYIFIAAVLFIAGIYFAPAIVDRNIRWMLVYPRWMAKLMEKYFSTRMGFFPMFIIILLLNNVSLFTGFLSGFLVILPFVLAFLTGFHVAVIGYDLMGWQGLWHMLVNPVAWLEFPAAWISFSLGIRLAGEIVVHQNFHSAVNLFHVLLPIYFKYVFSLLLVAALLESALIILAERHKNQP
ncbi:hypothetical protein B1H10_08140 [candidate division KSB1 bacterium 4484_188]|nr:MAG: hypothetical protein B1H10_08140 [candidate division KSB1 bacterium 4484_188]HFE64795.1 hypothetical protein [Caldithrix sp.]